jgi:hypothetical protein
VRIVIEGLWLRRAIEVGDVVWVSRRVAALHRRSRTPERAAIEDALARALDSWPAIAAGEIERAMMALHTRKEQQP